MSLQVKATVSGGARKVPANVAEKTSASTVAPKPIDPKPTKKENKE